MRRVLLLIAIGLATLVAVWAQSAQAFERTFMGQIAYRYTQMYPWHGGYYEAAWGMPVAMVVPPNVEFKTNWGWGVGNTRVTPIHHQFEANYPGPGYYDTRAFRPTPPWPSDTNQFGVYYVRGPW